MKTVRYEKELHLLLDRLDRRLDVLRQFGLKLWTGAMRASLADLERARVEHEKAQAVELMLLESDIRSMAQALPGKDFNAVLNRIAKLKGLLCMLFLGLIGWGVCDLANESMLRPRSAKRAGVRQVVRVRRRKDEEALVV